MPVNSKIIAQCEDNAGIDALWTSLENIDPKDPIPRRVVDDVRKMSPLGLICVVTWFGNQHLALQLCHILARALPPGIVKLVEHFLGLPYGALYLHTPRNICLMRPTMHAALDSDAAFLCPTRKMLEAILHAVRNHGLPLGETVVPQGVETNEKGFVKYTYTFPDGDYEYQYAPIMGRSKNSWTPSTRILRRTPEGIHHHKTPFTGVHSMPWVKIHIHPYFAVVRGHRALSRTRDGPVTTPAHLAREVELIRQIGAVLDEVYHSEYEDDRPEKLPEVDPASILPERLRPRRGPHAAGPAGH
ncbi:hypothetical protein FB107DRAFT_215890 [Schizophyllum commune]